MITTLKRECGVKLMMSFFGRIAVKRHYEHATMLAMITINIRFLIPSSRADFPDQIFSNTLEVPIFRDILWINDMHFDIPVEFFRAASHQLPSMAVLVTSKEDHPQARLRFGGSAGVSLSFAFA